MAQIPSHSLAAVVERFGEPISIREVPIPTEIEAGALLVKIDACTVCGSDTHLWQGSLAREPELPVILGHEMVGTIVKMGPGADRDSLDQDLRVGDRIVWAHTNCSHCVHCLQGMHTLCDNKRMYMYTSCENPPYLLGGFSEYGYVLPDSGRVKVPASVGDPLASLSACAGRSVVNAFAQTKPVELTDTVLIQGTGPLGLLGIALSRLKGAKRIIAIGGPHDRLELASEMGADEVISVMETSVEERAALIKDATGGRGADLAFEFSGNTRAVPEGLNLVRKGGTYMIVGQVGTQEVPIVPSRITGSNLVVQGSFSGGIEHYWQFLSILERNQEALPFHKIITNEYALKDVTAAMEAMRAEKEIKALLIP